MQGAQFGKVMTWKEIWQQANYILYSIQGGKSSKSSIGFLEFQDKVRKAFSIHTEITWAYGCNDKDAAIEALSRLKEFDEQYTTR